MDLDNTKAPRFESGMSAMAMKTGMFIAKSYMAAGAGGYVAQYGATERT
jgi:hypothetical protein